MTGRRRDNRWLRDELESLAAELDPDAGQLPVRITTQTEPPWEQDAPARALYVDERGVAHVTLRIDRRTEGEGEDA